MLFFPRFLKLILVYGDLGQKKKHYRDQMCSRSILPFANRLFLGSHFEPRPYYIL